MGLELELKKTRLDLLEEYLVLLLCLGCPGLRWMFSDVFFYTVEVQSAKCSVRQTRKS